jgi:hypothetical protein
MSYTEAAEMLGLTRDGLKHQMRDIRPVSRQTSIILNLYEIQFAVTDSLRRAFTDEAHSRTCKAYLKKLLNALWTLGPVP